MKIMVDKILDSILPTLFGAGGGLAGVVVNPVCVIPVTLDEIIGTIISAIIFATVGGIIGFYVNKLLKKIDK